MFHKLIDAPLNCVDRLSLGAVATLVDGAALRPAAWNSNTVGDLATFVLGCVHGLAFL